MTRYSPKVVHDPLHGSIDIRSVLPIIETREFQALSDKRQLGMTYLVFRYARHTRFEHCLGAYRATRTLTNAWIANGDVTKEQQDALVAYALLHDVGHPAFSHVTEDFCPLDDDERSLELIEGRLRKAIEQCGPRGTDVERVIALARHTDPLYLAVHDKNVGMEKLDYLERDGYYTGIGRPPGIDYLRKYLLFIDGHMAIDEKMVEHAIEIMNFYMKMYKEVYFRKALVIAQRMFQKAIYYLIQCGELRPEELYDLTDSELIGRMACTKHPVVQNMYARIRERRLYCEGLVVRAESTACETRVFGKHISIERVDVATMRQLVTAPSLEKGNHQALERLEANLADAIGIPQGAVLVVPVFNPERFKAKDLMIYDSDGTLHSLRERRPAHFNSMEEVAKSYAALRICSPPEYRRVISESSRVILDTIFASLQ